MTKKSQVRNLPRLQRQRVKFSKRDFWLKSITSILIEAFHFFSWNMYVFLATFKILILIFLFEL